MKIKIIVVLLILISSIIFIQADIIKEDNSEKYENYSNEIQNVYDKNPSDWTLKETCIFMKGCWDFKEKICYPYGYVKEGQYCSDKLEDNEGKIEYGFSEQKGWGNLCEDNFECESNLCYERKCIRTIESELMDTLIKRIEKIEEKINLLKPQNSEDKPSITGEIVSENSQERKGFFSRLFGK